METPGLTLPRALPVVAMRPPQANIPQTRLERDRIKALVQGYVRRFRPVPPMPIEELRRHAERVVEGAGIDPQYVDYTGVLLSNEAWRDGLAGIPYERRLLLLPKCLRVEDKCPAPFDEFGLLCKRCGLCSIQDLQDEAERLGYAVLVAEGSAIVMSIIETGKIEAIVGVSCLSVLERAFPFMEAAAVPGVAIPLLQDDCVDTTVDLDWVWDVIHLSSDDRTYRMDLDGIRGEVESWFTPEPLAAVMGPAGGRTEEIARAWLAKAGKRWRPFLAVCAYRALREDPDAALPEDLRAIAVAIECFHKASLVHDDIEDEDEARYDGRTVHAEWGVPVALNVGDFLLGEGYRLLASCDAPAGARAEMLRAAAEGHRTLSIGQGAELCWRRERAPLSSLQVLDIFRRKTAPAFEVALRLGALYAGVEAEAGVRDVLRRYSEAIGIAYQIRDDLHDIGEDGGAAASAARPSLPLAVGFERSRAHDELRGLLDRAWREGASEAGAREGVREAFERLKVEERCQSLLDAYKEEAIRALADLDNPSLKGLLRRVVGKIFNDIQLRGWCSEFEARNAAGREAGAPAPS